MASSSAMWGDWCRTSRNSCMCAADAYMHVRALCTSPEQHNSQSPRQLLKNSIYTPDLFPNKTWMVKRYHASLPLNEDIRCGRGSTPRLCIIFLLPHIPRCSSSMAARDVEARWPPFWCGSQLLTLMTALPCAPRVSELGCAPVCHAGALTAIFCASSGSETAALRTDPIADR